MGQRNRDAVRDFQRGTGLPSYYRLERPVKFYRQQREEAVRRFAEMTENLQFMADFAQRMHSEARIRQMGPPKTKGVPLLVLGPPRVYFPPSRP